MRQSFLSSEVETDATLIKVYDPEQFSSPVPFLVYVGDEKMMVVDRKHTVLYVVREHKRELRNPHARGTIVRMSDQPRDM